MRRPVKQLFLLGMLLCCCIAATAQESDTTYVDSTAQTETAGPYTEDNPGDQATRTVSYNKAAATPAEWRQVTSEKEFGYKNEREFTAAAKQPVKQEMPLLLRFLLAVFQFFTSLAGHIILWSLLGLLLFYIVYRLASGDGRIFARRNKKMVDTISTDGTISEEDLLRNNWEERLRAAIAAGETRLAIRYSYMLLLQLLQARNQIQYRQDKTNTDYYRELSESPVRQQFRQLSREYEYAWYGNFLPSADAFAAYLQIFNGVKKEIGAS